MKRFRQIALAMLALLELTDMGRSQTAETPDPAKMYQAKTFDSKTADGQPLTLPYRLLVPEKLEAGGQYPLVLFMHGSGERGTDNALQLKYLPTWLASAENRQKYPCFVVAPQCPDPIKWSDVEWGDKNSSPLPPISRPMQAAIGILDDVVEHYPVDRSRIYLAGLSMGGYGVWDLAERTPERFAALAAVCGGGDETKADRLNALPIWAWHGDADTVVPVERSRRMIAAIEKAGGKPKYTELPGVGHDSWTPAFNGPDNLLAWLFAQTKPPSGK